MNSIDFPYKLRDELNHFIHIAEAEYNKFISFVKYYLIHNVFSLVKTDF